MTAHNLKWTLVRYISRPEFWFSTLAFWALASALRSAATPWAQAALSEWLRWAVGIGTALMVGRLLTQTRLLARMAALCGAALTCSAAGKGFAGTWGITGPFLDHQLFGSALLITLPVTLSVALTARNTNWRTLARLIFFVLLMEIVLSQSRSAWAGASAGLFVFVGLWLRMSAGQGRRQLQSLALLTVGIIAAFALILGTTELQKPIALRLASLTALRSDTGWQTRAQIWRGTRQMIADAPALGTGLGRYPQQQRGFTHLGRTLTPQMRASLSEDAHSLYLQTAAEMGLPGLVCYLLGLLMLAGRSVYCLRRAWGRTPGNRESLLIATLSLVAAQSVDALASPSWQFSEVSLPFWVMLGLGMACTRRPDITESMVVSLRRPLKFAVAVAFGICAALCVMFIAPLSPVEAYAGMNRLCLTSVTIIPARTIVHNTHLTQTVTFTAIAHYRWSLSNVPSPDKDLTFDGPPDGISGTVFSLRGGTAVHGTGFISLDPAQRNRLTISPMQFTRKPSVLTITVTIDPPDGENRCIVTSRPAAVFCLP